MGRALLAPGSAGSSQATAQGFLMFFQGNTNFDGFEAPSPLPPPGHIHRPRDANMGLAAANSPCSSSPQDPLMVSLQLCPQSVTCPHTSVFHQDPQSCGVSRSCWSPTLQDWLRENRKARGAVPEGSYCWPGSRGSVRGQRHRGHRVTPLCPEPLVAAHSPWMCPSVGRRLSGLSRASPPTSLLRFGRENKQTSFFRVLLPWPKEGPASRPWKPEDLEPWLCVK